MKDSTSNPPQHRTRHLLRERRMIQAICCTVIVVLAVSFAFLLYSISRVLRESEQMLRTQAEGVAASTGSLVDNYARLCEILSVNQKVLRFAAYDGTESETILTPESYDLSKDLNSLVSVYGQDINTLAIYFVRSDAVITMARQLTRENNHLFFDSYPELSPSALQSIPASDRWWIHFGTSTDRHHWIVRKVQVHGTPVAYILVEFNLSQFVQRTATSSTLLMIGTDDSLLYANQEMDPDTYINSLSSQTLNWGRERYVSQLISTRLPDIQVVAGVSAAQIDRIRSTFFLVVFAAGLIVVLGITVLVQRLNRQILTPVEYLMETSRPKADSASGAIHQIADDLVSTRTANDQMRRERSNILPLALGRQLNHLIEASDSEEALLYAQSSLLLAGIASGEGYAAFAVSCIEDNKDFFKTMRVDPRLNSQGELFHSLLNNVLTDLLFLDFPGTVAPFRDDWFLVVVSCGSAADAEQIDGVVQTLLDTYETTFQAVLISTHTVWGATPQDFVHSVLAVAREISYLDFWGTERDASAEAGVPDTLPLYRKMIRKLFARLNVQDYASIPGLLDELFDQALPSGVEDIQVAKDRIYAMSALILAAIDEQVGSDHDFPAAQTFEQRLYRTGNLGDFKKELKSILNELIEYKKTQDTASTSSSRMEEIKQYILHHYTENELTAAAIAAEFKMSSSYLSRAFKESTGTNILDYIQRLRVDAAKKLLQTESVRSAAQQVGFWDTQGLVRAFKKHEGVTPSEYKHIHGKP